MILYIGDKELYDFVQALAGEVSTEIPPEDADKIIISEYSHNAVSIVRYADDNNIPVLGILDGYKSVAEAFGAECITIENCPEGKQELAILDTDTPLHQKLGHVVSVCRGTSVTIDEEAMPPELDCIARSEAGDIIGLCKNCNSPKIFAVNYYPSSALTDCGETIFLNFLKL